MVRVPEHRAFSRVQALLRRNTNVTLPACFSTNWPGQSSRPQQEYFLCQRGERGDRKQSLRQRKGQERKRAIFGGLERLKLPLEKPGLQVQRSPFCKSSVAEPSAHRGVWQRREPLGEPLRELQPGEGRSRPAPLCSGPLLQPGSKPGGHWAPPCRRPLLLLSRRLRAPGLNQPGCLAHAGTWASPRTGLCPCRVGLGLLT